MKTAGEKYRRHRWFMRRKGKLPLTREQWDNKNREHAVGLSLPDSGDDDEVVDPIDELANHVIAISGRQLIHRQIADTRTQYLTLYGDSESLIIRVSDHPAAAGRQDNSIVCGDNYGIYDTDLEGFRRWISRR